MIASRLAPLVLLLFGLACSTPGAGSAPEAQNEEVLSVARAQQEAWNRGDVEGYMRAGYVDSPDLVFFSGGDVTTGFQPVLARYLSRYKGDGAEMGKLEFSALETKRLGESYAMLRGHWQLDFERRADVGGLFTLVLRRTDAGWRIVHDHTSVASPG